MDKGVALAFTEGFAGGCDMSVVKNTETNASSRLVRNFVAKLARRGNGSKIVRDERGGGASCHSRNGQAGIKIAN